ncbi:putative disease resistance RPP13-like protein 1 [Prosopis cineraria]|uniref:putative disease resistance RPP13-like protein 1 n=1 Tax=Prosopis cineraria TaxID=364024 RepID=UPI00240FFB1C|nr:putative disease resistance RPP13-like protein 1 [Prosopis cineraria]XP_054815029.1 putative disease resistance RPP13-like protein 1 [Prosopis cineraria]XP_054815031.1 putative disease resistance RPP13-like protein 1 [Prosopis cineraria]XP_054815032.1 putative disease resistance RPP13-like protein 1 [Prosopis cineraria]XP_054815033.1 putative disease resistance RPP13-like protein 1 [Prosopis cineraria]XP_054815034.1 putative disease resistance RPP13-like protein 1 [Prosopis cineraria]
MVPGIVGGAFLSSFLQVAFDKMMSLEVREYFRGRTLDTSLMKKLKIALLSINSVIDDAEDKQFSDANVVAWLTELKHAVFDADDLLDEINYEAYKQEMEPETQAGLTGKVRRFFHFSSFDKEFDSRMKQLLENLEFLESRKTALGLKEVKCGAFETSTKLPTTSLVDQAGTYGRDDEKEIIIEQLLNDSGFSVISLVGMGGLGKTTLAQLVYNDERVEAEFDIKVWVSISDDFDILRLTRVIFKAVMGSYDGKADINMLQSRLKDILTKKKFLIVLDDVWCDDYVAWEAFRAPLISAVAGGRILITSRNQNVALVAGSDEIYQPHQLSDEDGWLLFAKYAFHNSPQASPDLEEIGRRIAKKCKGLPLALKTVGSLLGRKLSWEEWNSILTCDIWEVSHNNILPALRLSYHYLPSHLKHCFAYCSLLPKDYQFEKEELVLFWMAQDFLPASKSNKTIEEVGNECFQDLVSRSFFQKSALGGTHYVMHDLLNDLANFVSGEFCLRQEVKEVPNVSDKTRHLSFSHENGGFGQPEYLQKSSKLRSFLPFFLNPDFGWTSVVDELFKCKCLRALSLCYNFKITELPDSIGNLIHLRYLDLSGSGIRRLPDSICLLYNLQTLRLKNCDHLDELPANLNKLKRLRLLDLQYTWLKTIPLNLGELKDLRVRLTSFDVGRYSESNMEQLGKLNLQGELSIFELQNVVPGMDASTVNLKEKKCLDEVSFHWSPDCHNNSRNERYVLEKLQPHENLKKLSVMHYGGTRFPDWFSNALPNIVSLRLESCSYCLVLPSLGLLPSLKSLFIRGLDCIAAIGAEFLGSRSSAVSFGSLEILEFDEMVNWEEWECGTASRAFPCLKELRIRNCPKLKEKLPEQLPSLEELIIEDCQELVALVPMAPMIRSLTLRKCGNVKLEDIPSNLKEVSFHGPFSNVTLVEKIEHIIANTCIEKVDIRECPNLEFPSHHHDSLRDILILRSCVSLRNFALDLFPTLQWLYLDGCDNLEMISVSEGRKDDPTNLTDLNIKECPKFVSLSGGAFSAPRLKWCCFERLGNLESLANFSAPSLSILRVEDCPKLETLPEGVLSSKLRHLAVIKCPNLNVDWEKIAHIANVWIDDARQA